MSVDSVFQNIEISRKTDIKYVNCEGFLKLKDRRQYLLLMLREFKRINQLLLTPPETIR